MLASIVSLGAFASPFRTPEEAHSAIMQAHLQKVQDAVKAGDILMAIQLLGEVLSDAETKGNNRFMGIAYAWRARLESEQGESQKGSSDLQAAATAFVKAGLIDHAISALREKSVLEEKRGELRNAESTLSAACKLASANDLQDELTSLNCDLVRSRVLMGMKDAAKEALVDAETSKTTNEKLKAKLLMSRARYSGAFGEVEKALAAYNEAVPMLLRLKEVHEAANAQFNAALLLGTDKRYDEASSQIDSAIINFIRSDSLSGVGMALSLNAWHLIQQDRLDAAEPLLQKAAKALFETKNVGRLAENDERCAHYWMKRHDLLKAHDSAERAASIFEKMGATKRASDLRALFPSAYK